MEIMKDPSSFGERCRRSSTTHGCVCFFCLIGRPSGPGWVEGSIFRTKPGSRRLGGLPIGRCTTSLLPCPGFQGAAWPLLTRPMSAQRRVRSVSAPGQWESYGRDPLRLDPPLRSVRNSDPVYPRARISGGFAFSKEYDTQLPMPMPSLHGTRTGPIADSWPGRHITSPTLQTFRYRERLALPRAVFVTSRCASTATSRYV